MVMNRYDAASGKWSRAHDILIDGEGKRNAYWQMCTDSKGYRGGYTCRAWRETWLVETNHDMCLCPFYRFAASDLAAQRRYRLSPPITMATAEIAWPIPQKSELIEPTSMTTDLDRRPLIATYWREQATRDAVPLVSHDGKACTWRP